MISKDAFIAANRFGLGPLPLELGVIAKNPRDWLKRQITTEQKTPSLLQNLPNVAEIMSTYTRNRQMGNRGQNQGQATERAAIGNAAATLSVSSKAKIILIASIPAPST